MCTACNSCQLEIHLLLCTTWPSCHLNVQLQGMRPLLLQRAQEKLQLARSQRNRLLAAFEGVSAAEDDMEAVIARYAVHAVGQPA